MSTKKRLVDYLKYITAHTVTSEGSWTASGSVPPHQSITSSDHLLAGLPHGRSPSTIPSITVFTIRSSVIMQMWPNSFNFLCFIKSTIVQRLSTFSLILLLLILSLQHTFKILLQHFTSNAKSFLESAAVTDHVLAAQNNIIAFEL